MVSATARAHPFLPSNAGDDDAPQFCYGQGYARFPLQGCDRELRARERATIPSCLLNSLARPPVAASPIRALGARCAFGVIDPLFVRTTDDGLGNHNGFDGMRFDKCYDLLANLVVRSYVATLGEPLFERIGLAVFLFEDSNDNFRCQLCGGTVERNGRCRISAKSFLDLFIQP